MFHLATLTPKEVKQLEKAIKRPMLEPLLSLFKEKHSQDEYKHFWIQTNDIDNKDLQEFMFQTSSNSKPLESRLDQLNKVIQSGSGLSLSLVDGKMEKRVSINLDLKSVNDLPSNIKKLIAKINH